MDDRQVADLMEAVESVASYTSSTADVVEDVVTRLDTIIEILVSIESNYR